MEDRRSFVCWVKNHKKQLILAGVGVGAVILVILGIKNREAIVAMWESLSRSINHGPKRTKETIQAPAMVAKVMPKEPATEIVETVTVCTNPIPFEVSRHIRNLPANHHASPEKIKAALRENINLKDNQTWVEQYWKNRVA